MAFILKSCSKCGGQFGSENFTRSNSFLFRDGYIPMCNSCIRNYLEANDGQDMWTKVDKLCQLTDTPFVVRLWQETFDQNGYDAFPVYVSMFTTNKYEQIEWKPYYDKYKALERTGKLEKEIPLLSEEQSKELRKKWGGNYDDEALEYLEKLYNGLYATQHISGKLQDDQAQKICKLSYEIDNRIRDGIEFDKILGSYDKLIKAADFTPQNSKNLNDFDSIGELTKWMEKRGWRCSFFDGVTRDIVDETIKNFESFNRRLYTNETGVAEEIQQRIESLKAADQIEKESDIFATKQEYDLDEFERDGFNKLMGIGDESFDLELESGEDV